MIRGLISASLSAAVCDCKMFEKPAAAVLFVVLYYLIYRALSAAVATR